MDFDNIFDGLKENKKTLLIVLILFIALIIISIFNLIFDNKNVDSFDNEKIIESFAKLYYEEGYYPQITSAFGDNYVDKLKEYEKEGIKVTLLDIISNFSEVDEHKFYAEENYCDFEKTYAVIYPKSPYSLKDYKIDVKVSCKKEL